MRYTGSIVIVRYENFDVEADSEAQAREILEKRDYGKRASLGDVYWDHHWSGAK